MGNLKELKSNLPSWKKCAKYYAIAWVIMYLCNCCPFHAWRNPKRLVFETISMAVGLPLNCFTWWAPIPFHLPDEWLGDEKNTHPHFTPFEEMSWDSNGGDAVAHFGKLRHQNDRIIIWRDFAKGHDIMKWGDIEYLKKHASQTKKFGFFYNDTIGDDVIKRHLTIPEALELMLQEYPNNTWYLNGCSDCLPNIEKLKKDVAKMYHDTKLDTVVSTTGQYPVFIYYGNRVSAGAHSALLNAISIQVANTKRFRFVHPRYTPYTQVVREMPHKWINFPGGRGLPPHETRQCLIGGVTHHGYDFFPDYMNVPFLDVESRPGDLLYFPAFWFHQVNNIMDEFGLFISIRQFKDFLGWKTIKNLLVPLTAEKGVSQRQVELIATATTFLLTLPHRFYRMWKYDPETYCNPYRKHDGCYGGDENKNGPIGRWKKGDWSWDNYWKRANLYRNENRPTTLSLRELMGDGSNRYVDETPGALTEDQRRAKKGLGPLKDLWLKRSKEKGIPSYSNEDDPNIKGWKEVNEAKAKLAAMKKAKATTKETGSTGKSEL